MEEMITGGCACGAVRYQSNVAPAMAFHCHCRDCQRATGSGHASMAIFPRDALSLTGEVRYHAVRADRGGEVRRGFCPQCGSPIVAEPGAEPGLVAVFAASLDDPSIFSPKAVLYAKRAYAWDVMDPKLQTFDALMPQPPAGT